MGSTPTMSSAGRVTPSNVPWISATPLVEPAPLSRPNPSTRLIGAPRRTASESQSKAVSTIFSSNGIGPRSSQYAPQLWPHSRDATLFSPVPPVRPWYPAAMRRRITTPMAALRAASRPHQPPRIPPVPQQARRLSHRLLRALLLPLRLDKPLIMHNAVGFLSIVRDRPVLEYLFLLGGTGYAGPTACVAPYQCTLVNSYYSQCL